MSKIGDHFPAVMNCKLKYTILSGLTNDPKVQPTTFRKSEREPAKLTKAIEYGRQVGGGSVHFTANYWRFHENDFHEHSSGGCGRGVTCGLADTLPGSRAFLYEG